jgi:hypothetical protein
MDELTAQMWALKERARIIKEMIAQGYTEKHGEYMANLLCPTPAQQYAARRTRKGARNGK